MSKVSEESNERAAIGIRDRRQNPQDAEMTVRWQFRAACRGMDTELFFPLPGDSQTGRRAKAICAQCPVTRECRAEAPDHGIWGGTTPKDRRHEQRNPTQHRSVCGSTSGYAAHARNRETACRPCLDIQRLYRKQHRRSQPKSPGDCGTTKGYRNHLKRGEEPCKPCAKAAGDAHRKRVERMK